MGPSGTSPWSPRLLKCPLCGWCELFCYNQDLIATGMSVGETDPQAEWVQGLNTFTDYWLPFGEVLSHVVKLAPEGSGAC